MSDADSMRQTGRDGESVSPVARATPPASTSGRATSPPSQHVAAATRPSKLDPHEPLIDLWVEEDASNRGEQRHTARRMWQRLRDEEGADVSEANVCERLG